MASQKFLSLIDAIESVTGRRISKPTAWRWCIHGISGVRLRRQRVGGRWFTTLEWVREFMEATTEMAEAKLTPPKQVTRPIVGVSSKRREEEKQFAANKLAQRLGRA